MQNLKEDLEHLKSQNQYRTLIDTNLSGNKICIGTKEYINFMSNDYLGLSANLDFQKLFFKSLNYDSFLMGSTSSRLLGGNNLVYSQTEDFIASLYIKNGARDNSKCLFFNSGYHANTGILPALAGSDDLILADKLVHASLIDSLKLTKAKWLRFAHNDMENLKDLLQKHRKNYRNVYIITESLFSMDGDFADLKNLVALKEEFDALLYVDEAHSVGCYGDNGLGLAQQEKVLGKIDFLMCTLGKAIASEGAFLICCEDVRNMLINKCRSLIFTTAIAPINVLWTKFVFENLQNFSMQRKRLQILSGYFRSLLVDLKLSGNSQIVSVILGDNQSALKVAKHLKTNGVLAPAIRYPSVAKNSARIRFSLSEFHDFEDLDLTAKLLKEQM